MQIDFSDAVDTIEDIKGATIFLKHVVAVQPAPRGGESLVSCTDNEEYRVELCRDEVVKMVRRA